MERGEEERGGDRQEERGHWGEVTGKEAEDACAVCIARIASH